MGEECNMEEKLRLEFCRASVPAGEWQINSAVHRRGKPVPAGYTYQSVSLSGPCAVRRIIQSSDCFFPASGNRNNDNGNLNYGNNGNYWSSSANGTSNAYNLNFNSSNVNPDNNNNRTNGRSVRCVRPGAFITVFNQINRMNLACMEKESLRRACSSMAKRLPYLQLSGNYTRPCLVICFTVNFSRPDKI
jgi:hypothetical protein